MTDSIPAAVPLDICLANIYSSTGETSLEVAVAITILEKIVSNNGLEKFRSLNSKVLHRISTPDNLALWYVLRHAGFYKEGSRLICPNTVPLETISEVLAKLVDLSQLNAKILSGEIVRDQPKFSSPRSQPPSEESKKRESEAQAETMVDGPVVANEAQPQESTQMTDVSVPTQPQPQPPTMSDENESPPTSPQSTSPTTAGTTKNVAQMTPAEKKEYIAQLMAQKKAAAAAKK